MKDFEGYDLVFRACLPRGLVAYNLGKKRNIHEQKMERGFLHGVILKDEIQRA